MLTPTHISDNPHIPSIGEEYVTCSLTIIAVQSQMNELIPEDIQGRKTSALQSIRRVD